MYLSNYLNSTVLKSWDLFLLWGSELKESVSLYLSIIQFYFLNFSPSDEQKVTDANILKLARLLAPDRWSPLYVALGIDYSIAEGIKGKSKEKTEQYIHLLQNWKAASTRTRKDLNAILNEIEAGGLVDQLYLASKV